MYQNEPGGPMKRPGLVNKLDKLKQKAVMLKDKVDSIKNSRLKKKSDKIAELNKQRQGPLTRTGNAKIESNKLVGYSMSAVDNRTNAINKSIEKADLNPKNSKKLNRKNYKSVAVYEKQANKDKSFKTK